MKLQTQIPLKQAENQIGYDSQLLLLGSCFVENMGNKLDYFKFRQLQNPFGILFHPLAIEQLVSGAVWKEFYTESDIFNRNGLWHCFDAHSDLSDASQEKLLSKLNNGLKATRESLAVASHIIITLGTAWVYRHSTSGGIVANCHKVPQREFSKELIAIPEITNSLGRIVKLVRSVNANAQLIFTISPVRHLKDGFIENQRSKARLISAVQDFCSTYETKTTEGNKGVSAHFEERTDDHLEERMDSHLEERIESHREERTVSHREERMDNHLEERVDSHVDDEQSDSFGAQLHPNVNEQATYFPSYEIMMDELRDYRFYDRDMLHPNEIAIDYIWEKFKQTWISEEAYAVMSEVDDIQKGLRHRPFNADSEQHRKFRKTLETKMATIRQEYPFMEF